MKKNILVIAVVALVGTLIFKFDTLRAQPTTTPDAARSSLPGPSGPGVRPMPPGMRGRPGGRYAQTIMFLRMSKAELEHATEDFDGHRQSAIDACDKAIAELQAVQTSVQSAAAAKAAAAKAAAAAQTNQAPTTPAVPGAAAQ